jgi:glycosyltransferase involved in cell wall biosynthesis
MKIQFITYEFPPIGGGTGKAVYYTAREFVRMKHDVSVITICFSNQPQKEIVDGIKVFRIPAIRREKQQSNPAEILTFFISGIFNAGKISLEVKPDMTLAYFTIPSGIISLWLKLTRKIPYITLLRGQDVPGWLPEKLKNYHVICKPLIRHIWNQSTKVVANSVGLARMANATNNDLDIPVIPNGVDADKYTYMPEKTVSENVKILFCGRLRYQKGLTYLLEALAKIKSRKNMPDVILEIAGFGSEEGNLRQLSKRLGLENEVRFIGQLDENKLVETYQQSDIFVNPSLNEGMPNSVLEAMSCGLPCIVTNIEGNNEVVRNGQCGLVIPPKDTDSLADALSRLIKDRDERERFGRMSRRVIEEEYSWRKTAEQLMSIVNGVSGR